MFAPVRARAELRVVVPGVAVGRDQLAVALSGMRFPGAAVGVVLVYVDLESLVVA